VRQECANFPDAGQLMAWDFADPKPKDSIARFEVTLRELNERIKMFASVPTKEEKPSP
jgi:ArsR family transcriptional regulator